MKMAFLMNPLGSVNPAKDTTYRFMLGASRRGHDVHFVPSAGVSLVDGEVVFDTLSVTPREDPEHPFVENGPVSLAGADVDAVFIRTDPPFDATYLMHTWLLDHLPPRVFVMNDPGAVRTVNEKIWALQFTDLVPTSLVAAEIARIEQFLTDHGSIVVKPTDGYGGEGVFIVRAGDKNARVIFETLTSNGRVPVIAQEFVPESEVGDKRILLLDGEPLGAVLRVHSEADHRNNFFAGGTACPVELGARDHVIIDALRPHLLSLGLHFVGIDVIGEFLIEVNVTSPTCLQEMNQLYGLQLEDRVIEFVEHQVTSRQELSSPAHLT